MLTLLSMVLAVLAYIDPGSGALLWQAALSAFFGGVFLARKTLLRAATRMRQVLRGPREQTSVPAEPPPDRSQSA